LQIGNARIMLADEAPERDALSPPSRGGASGFLMLYVEDVDRVFKQALAAGGKQKQAVQDQFYGDRSGTLEDPVGHAWTVATHKEDISPEEMKRRGEEFMKKRGAPVGVEPARDNA